MMIKKIDAKKIVGFAFIFILFLIPIFVLADNFTYIPMEEIPGQPDTPKDFYTYVSYLYRFGIAAVGIAALFMITVGGFMYITSAGNNAKMENAKGVITDALAGLILALSAYLILYTINPDLVRIQPPKPPPAPTTPAAGAATAPPTSPTGGIVQVGGISPGGTTVTSICSGATENYNTCAGVTTCSISGLAACKNNLIPYETIIQVASANTNLNPKEVKAIICAESGGNSAVQNITVNPPSCGLMQVRANSGYSCTSEPGRNLLDPTVNITEGTRILWQKKNAVASLSYADITKDQMAYAAYNCCSNGEIPNDPSRDCGAIVPKWACNLNPGTGNEKTGNMCAVRDYVCSKVDACVSQF